MQIEDCHKTTMRGKSSCTFTLMVEGDNVECHMVQRQSKFTLKIRKAITEKTEKSRPLQNLQKLPL